MAVPGWYDDPHGGGGQRWWDGERWSEHTNPPPGPQAPPAVPPGATSPPGAIPPPGAPAGEGAAVAAAMSTPTAQSAGPGHGEHGGQGGGKGGGKGAGKLILIILAALLVVVIGAVVVSMTLVLAGDDASEAGDSLTVGPITAGDQRVYEVAEDGGWELVIAVPAGMLVIDARGDDGFDPVAELHDIDGQEIDSNDDRSSEQMDRYGGGGLDSLIEREVPAGTYRVVITGFAGQGGSGQVSFPVVGG